MSRPNKGRSIGTHEHMANLIKQELIKRERDIGWLARKMTDSGCPITYASLWKRLTQCREFRVNEFVAIAQILEFAYDDLAGINKKTLKSEGVA